MSFARFSTAVLEDPALEQRLRALADWQSFVAAAVEAAGERDIELTREELEDARRRADLDWRTRWA